MKDVPVTRFAPSPSGELPLRAALAGRLAGPELAPLLRAIPAGTARLRLARFCNIA